MLTGPIPLDAMPMVERLRRDVPAPVELPKPQATGILRYIRVSSAYEDVYVTVCPLGLHPDSKYYHPASKCDLDATKFTPSELDAVLPLIRWWDKQEDAVAAHEALWNIQMTTIKGFMFVFFGGLALTAAAYGFFYWLFS